MADGKNAKVEIYEAEVVEVFSGDDLVVMLDLGVDDLYKRKRIRLSGVDTPSGIGASAGTEAGKLRTFVREVCHGRKVKITVVSKRASSWVAVVEVPGRTTLRNLNEELQSQGYKYEREKARCSSRQEG